MLHLSRQTCEKYHNLRLPRLCERAHKWSQWSSKKPSNYPLGFSCCRCRLLPQWYSIAFLLTRLRLFSNISNQHSGICLLAKQKSIYWQSIIALQWIEMQNFDLLLCDDKGRGWGEAAKILIGEPSWMESWWANGEILWHFWKRPHCCSLISFANQRDSLLLSHYTLMISANREWQTVGFHPSATTSFVAVVGVELVAAEHKQEERSLSDTQTKTLLC